MNVVEDSQVANAVAALAAARCKTLRDSSVVRVVAELVEPQTDLALPVGWNTTKIGSRPVVKGQLVSQRFRSRFRSSQRTKLPAFISARRLRFSSCSSS